MEFKQFIKKHKTKLLVLGGVIVVTVVTIALTKGNDTVVKEIVKTTTDVEDLPGYDIWACVGTECSEELFNDVRQVVESYGKSINFDLYYD